MTLVATYIADVAALMQPLDERLAVLGRRMIEVHTELSRLEIALQGWAAGSALREQVTGSAAADALARLDQLQGEVEKRVQSVEATLSKPVLEDADIALVASLAVDEDYKREIAAVLGVLEREAEAERKRRQLKEQQAEEARRQAEAAAARKKADEQRRVQAEEDRRRFEAEEQARKEANERRRAKAEEEQRLLQAEQRIQSGVNAQLQQLQEQSLAHGRAAELARQNAAQLALRELESQRRLAATRTWLIALGVALGVVLLIVMAKACK